MKTITTSKGEFFLIDSIDSKYYIKELNRLWDGTVTNGKPNHFSVEPIGYCSEIIKDEELAKRVLGDTESFASLMQANDIDLNEQDWFVVKKL